MSGASDLMKVIDAMEVMTAAMSLGIEISNALQQLVRDQHAAEAEGREYNADDVQIVLDRAQVGIDSLRDKIEAAKKAQP